MSNGSYVGVTTAVVDTQRGSSRTAGVTLTVVGSAGASAATASRRFNINNATDVWCCNSLTGKPGAADCSALSH